MDLKEANDAGKAIRKHLMNEGKNPDHVLQSRVLKLNDAVNMANRDMFLEELIRLHNDLGLSISEIFMECIDDEKLKNIGYAFLLGLKSDTA